MNVIGPTELAINSIRRRLRYAFASEVVAGWRDRHPDDQFQFNADRSVQIGCFEVASALGRRALFDLDDPVEYENLPTSMLDAALKGALVHLDELIQYWDEISAEFWDRTEFEVIDDIEYLLDSRIGFFGVVQIFDALLEQHSNSPAASGLRSMREVLTSMLKDLDAVIAENRGIVALMATNNWCASTSIALSQNAVQPRPWWLTSELELTYHEQQMDALKSEQVGNTSAILEFVSVDEPQTSLSANEGVFYERNAPLALAAERDEGNVNRSVFAEFRGGIAVENYVLLLKCEDGIPATTVAEARSRILESDDVAFELRVSTDQPPELTHSRIYVIRFETKLIDVEVKWNAIDKRFVGQEIAESEQIDLDERVHLRRRQ